MRVILYLPEWQVLRLSCLEPYNSYGGLTVRPGAEDSVKRLMAYLDSAKAPGYMDITDEEEKALRAYRIHNLLTATTNGFMENKTIDKSVVEFLKGFRDQVQEQLDNSLVVNVADRWDWEVVKYQFDRLFGLQPHWFMALIEDFEYRRKYNNKDSFEFKKTLELMYEVRDRRKK